MADTINGTYSTLCFHMFFTFIARSWYSLHSVVVIIILLLQIVWFMHGWLTMLLVAHCHIECQTIGLSLTGMAGEERN